MLLFTVEIPVFLAQKTPPSSDLEKILDDSVLSHPKVAHIKCNPVNATAMGKALKRIIKGEDLHVPPLLLDSLINSCKGDLRSAIHALQFESVIGLEKPKRGAGKKKGSQGKRGDAPAGKPQLQRLKSADGRDEMFSVFHSLGKVLHAKEDALADPERVIERAEVGHLRFVEFLHQNLIEHLPGVWECGGGRASSDRILGVIFTVQILSVIAKEDTSPANDMESISQILDDISLSDVLAKASDKRFGSSGSAVPESMCSSLAARSFLNIRSRLGKIETTSWRERRWQSLTGPQTHRALAMADAHLLDVRRILYNPNKPSAALPPTSIPMAPVPRLEMLQQAGLIFANDKQQQLGPGLSALLFSARDLSQKREDRPLRRNRQDAGVSSYVPMSDSEGRKLGPDVHSKEQQEATAVDPVADDAIASF